MNTSAQPHDIAFQMLKQGHSPAQVWEALVSGGMEGSAAEGMIKNVLHVLQEQEVLQRNGFCPNCFASSVAVSSGDISTMNGTGQAFYGGASPCSVCGSDVRILFFCFAGFPLFPLESYRYRDLGNNRFVARKTRGDTSVGHLLSVWGSAILWKLFWLLLIVLIITLVAYCRSK